MPGFAGLMIESEHDSCREDDAPSIGGVLADGAGAGLDTGDVAAVVADRAFVVEIDAAMVGQPGQGGGAGDGPNIRSPCGELLGRRGLEKQIVVRMIDAGVVEDGVTHRGQ